MNLHAKLIGVEGLERPLVIHGHSPEPLREWATEILKKYPEGKIEIWESRLVLRETITAEAKA